MTPIGALAAIFALVILGAIAVSLTIGVLYFASSMFYSVQLDRQRLRHEEERQEEWRRIHGK